MFSILISEKGGETKRLDFDRPEITIGRVAGNDIVLPRGNISKRHSRIVFKDGKFIIVDLKSTNGTFVNGRKITSPLVVKGSDKIYVGDFIMTIEEGSGAAASSSAELDGGRPPPPPPPKRTGLTPMIGAGSRAEATTMDMSARETDDMDDDNSDDEESAKSPVAASPPPESRPPLPPIPPRPGLNRPPLGTGPEVARATLTNEAIRDAAAARAGLSPMSLEPPATAGAASSAMDRPVVAADRISDKATMMATDGAAARAVSAPVPAAVVPPLAVPPVAQPTPAPTASAPPSASSAPAMPPAAPPAPTTPASGPPVPAAPRPAFSRPGQAATPAMTPMSAARPPASRLSAPATPAVSRPSSAAVQASSDDPQRRRYHEALNQVIGKALDQLGLKDASPEQLTEATPKLDKALRDLAEKIFPLPMGLESDQLAKHASADLLGAGPLDDLLNDETVHEVAVASHDRIYVDRGSGQSLSERIFASPTSVNRAIGRLLARVGGKLESALIEARLEGGAVMQAVLPPYARVPSLVVRRARKTGGRLQDLVNQGVLSGAMSEFLEVCMRERRNLVVSGYGRLTMLGALGGATAAGARVITVEPVSELDLSTTHAAWIGLIARGTEVRSVMGYAVRMHPDHLLITDVRGPEALDVAAALCGGQGVVVGVDAASAREALGRIESLGRLAGESPSRKALREELAQAVNLAVHVGRTAAGAYRVMEISEVTLADEGGIDLIPVFTFKPEGGDGQFVATGHVPAFAG